MKPRRHWVRIFCTQPGIASATWRCRYFVNFCPANLMNKHRRGALEGSITLRIRCTSRPRVASPQAYGRKANHSKIKEQNCSGLAVLQGDLCTGVREAGTGSGHRGRRDEPRPEGTGCQTRDRTRKAAAPIRDTENNRAQKRAAQGIPTPVEER